MKMTMTQMMPTLLTMMMINDDDDDDVTCDQKWQQHFLDEAQQQKCPPRAEALKYDQHIQHDF